MHLIHHQMNLSNFYVFYGINDWRILNFYLHENKNKLFANHSNLFSVIRSENANCLSKSCIFFKFSIFGVSIKHEIMRFFKFFSLFFQLLFIQFFVIFSFCCQLWCQTAFKSRNLHSCFGFILKISLNSFIVKNVYKK